MAKHGAGMKGLALFQRQRPVKTIAKQKEERFYMPIDRVPTKYLKQCAGVKRRSCILNKSTKATRFEVSWSTPRPSLHTNVDMGSGSFPVLHALYDQDRGKVAGWFEPDPPHRRHNNHHIACHAADLKPVKKEIQIGLLTNEAPFKGCGFWGQLKEYADELFEVSYPKLSHHMHKGRVPIYEYGTFLVFVFWFLLFVFQFVFLIYEYGTCSVFVFI